MSLAARQRRPLPSDTSSQVPYTKLDKKKGGGSGDDNTEPDRGLGWFLPLLSLAVLRYMSATTNIIHDCDEVFNYWEPLHYLLYNSGFQTWEYSSNFALRSYMYILFHKVVGGPASWWFVEEKVRHLFLKNLICIFLFFPIGRLLFMVCLNSRN